MNASCPGASRFKDAVPEMIRCPHCDTEVEIWSDEFRARCQNCRAWVFREMGAS
jgi:DNA-directed RNA polymerase subunit RPC12/RpoP